MTPLKRGLGRGLSSLIPQKRLVNTMSEASSSQQQGSVVAPAEVTVAFALSSEETAKEKTGAASGVQLMSVHPSLISPNPYQPRKNFDHSDLEDLISSIREHGILQPLVVTRDGERFELIAGERRLRAAQFLELSEVPVVVRAVEDHQKLELALIENVQRQELTPLEEAVAYRQLIADFNLTQEEVAQRVGKSRPKIANTMRLLNLPAEILAALEAGTILESHARALAGLTTDEERLALFKQIIEQKLQVREVETRVSNASKHSRKPRTEMPVWMAEHQKLLQNALGTKVAIQPQGEGGHIVIDFYRRGDLEEIVRVITE